MNTKTTELPLQGKYLEYSPEITFDVFKLVWDKLISLGYHSSNSMSVEYRYDEFKRENPYFRETLGTPLALNCFGTSHNFKETTVQEILGYSPFIKETTTTKDWNSASEEELLQEAKRRYPIGCKIKLIGLNKGGDFETEVRFTKYKFYGNSKRKQLYVDSNLLLFNEGVWAEIESLPEVETEEVIPEYIECIKPQCGYFIPGNIYKVVNTKCRNGRAITSNIRCNHYEANSILYVNLTDPSSFKPSTKEAFDAQNNPKPIEKWSVGSYVVAINDGHARGKPVDKYKIGFIDVITNKFYDETIGLKFSSNCCNNSDFKWFATKPEAEEFAKTLIKPIEDTIECEKCSGTGEVMTAKLYPNGHTEVNEECPVCGGEGIIYKPKQLLKQAVHCKTIEEYKFTKEKLGAIFYKNAYIKEGSVIKLDRIGSTISLDDFTSKYSDYKLLSFQEWCDLNGYKMKVEQPLKQVVQCTTHEEWDFVISKLSSSSKLSRQRNKFEKFIKENPNGIAINTVEDLWSDIDYWKEEGYQILSFQKWCDLNEYKMESKQPLKQMDKSKIFEVGDYVVITKSNINWTREMDSEIGKVVKITDINSRGYITYKGKPKWSFGVYDNHFRHATQEEIEDLKTVSTGILDESCIGKFISFNCGKCFYDEALIIKENGYIYLLNNCYSNNNEHINKSIYKYSLKFSNLAEVESICTDIKLLNTEEVLESQYQKSVQSDGLRLKTKNSHITIDYIKIEPKEKTKLHEFEFNYLPEPE